MINQGLIKKEVEFLKSLFPFIELDDKIVSLDIETRAKPGHESNPDAALSPWTGEISCVGIYGPTFAKVYRGDAQLKQLSEFLKDKKITAHNGKFDLKFLVHYGIISLEQAKVIWAEDSSILAAVSPDKIPDEYIKSYETKRQSLNKSLPHGKGHRQARGGSLKLLSPYFLNVEPFWESTIDHDNDKYVLLDCLYTYYLTDILKKRVNKWEGTKCYNDLMNRSRLLLQVELEGIKLDIPESNKRAQENKIKLIELESKIKTQWANQFNLWRELQQDSLRQKYIQMSEAYAQKRSLDLNECWSKKYEPLYTNALAKADFELNLNAPTQLKWLLKEGLGYNIVGLDGEESADKEVLLLLSDTYEDVKNLVEYRKCIKLDNTYYPELVEYAKFDGRVHCNFNITGARTGRLSSSGPNLQNQPGHLHDLFVAEDGNILITKDLSALEPVLIAFFTEDKNLIDIVQSGASFHSVNAKQIFNLDCEVSEVAKKYPNERKAAKEFGLSILYGSGAKRVMQTLRKYGYSFSLDECKKMVYRVRDYYSGVWSFKTQLDEMIESGEVVYNYLGRPVSIKNVDEIYMTAFNSLIQGSGSDILCQSLVNLTKDYPWIKLRLLVHDEAVIEVPESKGEEAEKLLEKYMTEFVLTTKHGPVKLKVEGKRGKSWEK